MLDIYYDITPSKELMVCYTTRGKRKGVGGEGEGEIGKGTKKNVESASQGL